MIGANLIARALKAHGVDFVSTLVGNGIDPVLYACRQVGMRIIDTHNEQTASYMAESYARLTGKVGVCAVSSSVGFTNALSGVVNAHFDGAPLLLISGASDHHYADRGSFQDFDQVNAALHFCKYARLVDRAEKIGFYIHEAMASATSGRPGPVHLTVPLDVLAADTDDVAAYCQEGCGAGAVHMICAGSPEVVTAAANLITQAERPLLIAGSGVFYAHGEEALARFATQTNIPVMVPIWDRGSIAAPLPQFMGVVGAASGSPCLLDRADLIILAGAHVDYRVGYLEPPAVQAGARTIRISANADELRQGIEPAVAVHGDPRSVFQQLCALLPESPAATHTRWLEEAQRRDQEFRSRWRMPVSPSDRPATGRHLVEALRPFVQGDAVFVVDGGNIGQWVHMALSDRYPGHWLTCGASGVVGFGLGGAMAARLAYPERPVILLSGDGSMGFTTADLESAARHRLPFVAVVANDQAWGIVVSGQKRKFGDGNEVACRFGPIRFDLIADACGAMGMQVDDMQELGLAVEKSLAAGRPCVINVPIAHAGPADDSR